jgi:hypothetical protein
MANNFTDVVPILIAQGLETLRSTCYFTRLINRDFENTPANTGDTINVYIPSSAVDEDVAPSVTKAANNDTKPKKVPVTLDQWRHSGFYLTDKEAEEIAGGVQAKQASEHVKALAQRLNSYALAQYKGVYGYVGTAGTTPFAADTTAATQARKILNKQEAGLTDRRIILDPDAEALAVELAKLTTAQNTGGKEELTEAAIGRKLGFDWFMDQQIPTHASTALTAGACTVNGVNAVGAGSTDGGRTGTVSIAKAANASPLVKGDIISIAGDAQTYVVTADTNLIVGNTAVPIAPALKKATVGAEVVTLKASHVVNLAFHRDAFAFASRPLQKTSQNTVEMMSIPDPVTGIVLRLELVRQNKQWYYDFDVLYGVKLVREELACRIAG